jgi:hypothetical protein
MKTKKRNINKNNKTKKNIYRNNTIDKNNSILSIYNKNDSNINNQKKLSCFLGNNSVIKNYTFKIFYYMLNYWKTNTHSNWSSIIKHSLIEKVEDNTILKIGLSEDEFEKIVQLINNREKKEFFEYIDNKLLKVTSCINSLAEPEYTIYHVDFNKNLQKVFLKELENIMFVKNIQWKDIKNNYNLLKNKKDKNMYNFFVFDIIYGADKTVDSIYRKNIGNMNFFREKLKIFKSNKNNFFKLNKCNNNIISNKNYKNYGIYNSTQTYKISKKNPYYKIMHKFNNNVLSGPSGSTAVLFIMLFQFYNFPFTYKNKILLLGMLIADFIPLWHSIPEILLSAYPEFKDNKIPKYNLNLNPTVYSIQLLKKFIQ